MDRFDHMRVFVRILERGSFVRAAEDLSLPASTVTDALKQLEARLGTRLLQRTTRQVRATPDGEAYYRRCLSILADMEDAESAFSSAKPRGFLHVEAQGSQVRRIILPGLPAFLDRYPELELYVSEGDRFVDLIREGVDCALRAGQPAESDLIARRLALMPEGTFASPAYLARHGTPPSWDQLAGHKMVGFRSSATGGVLPLEFRVGKAVKTVSLPCVLSVNGAESYKEAALQGLGLIQVPHYGVEAELRDGRLVEVLAHTPPTPLPLYVLYPRNRQLSLRVRVFIDWVAGEYARHLPAS
ncbi:MULTISPECIES: LysR family transcriptional regulator [unclassified Acidocella]|uniref:LysR family transcriptional regulator n=1 Tax=unclassified Acidocella TaxID=2648610 RepID=UPI00028C63CF|nr:MULTISPECIES: LysR family transcriptional regulator [unclassified Acidocella]EKM99960.1 LysR family transcriptional regulator [Acidocella sp. MX-AZ02]WBO59563.1 LysR family transcriptional regulator [Acidocella sp. MX-AZ03]